MTSLKALITVALGWPKMYQKCRTYRDQCFSHLIYLVIVENGQKSAEMGHLTPLFGPSLIWLIYYGAGA